MCTFTPRLANESRKISRRLEFEPIYKRYPEEAKIKERKMEEKRIQLLCEQTKQLTPKKSDPEAGEFHFELHEEESPFKRYEKCQQKVQKKKRDFYKQGVEWLEQRKAKIIGKQAEVIEMNFEEEQNLFVPKINRRSKSVVKMSFSQRQKQYERNTVQSKQNIVDKELSQFTYSPRINLKSQRIAEKSLTRIPLTERKMKKGIASAMALLMPDDEKIKFYDDDLN